MQMAQTMNTGGRIILGGIDSRSWEHPSDGAALTALRKVPGFDTVLRKLFGLVGEQSLRLFHQANAALVTDEQFPRLYESFMECCAVLDIETIPQLYVTQVPLLSARTIGLDDPFIVFSTSTIEILDNDELHFILGHELGHAMSGHALYKTMLGLLLQLAIIGMGIPLTRLTFMGLIMALREWDRKSELSADRAGMLCVQDSEVAYRTFMKMAAGTRTEEMDLEAFKNQARAYQDTGTKKEGFFKILNALFASHPFAVTRLAEALRFTESGDYKRLLGGDYANRTDPDLKMTEDIKTAIAAYRERLAESDDPLAQWFNAWAEKASDFADGVRKPRTKAGDDLEDYANTGFDLFGDTEDDL
jgi:Zn-dependent protease with chaperone function